MTEREHEPVRWGVLGTADIAVEKVVPAMLESKLARVDAMASRSADRADAVARRLGVPRSYGSYEDLLADEAIEAVYIPLPNHLHARWAIAAAEAGKHVLCEKPLSTTSTDARRVIEACGAAGVKVMEAFMYRLHPMWVQVRRMIDQGVIGDLTAVQSIFSYHNVSPDDIRNIAEFGGGALYDIGCYNVNVSRMLFGAEPVRVKGAVVRDVTFGTDILTSGLLEFESGHASFLCSTQMEPDQRVAIQGTTGRIVVEIPFNIPPDVPTKILHYSGGRPPVAPGVATHEISPRNQYSVQADLFSEAIRSDNAVPTPPEDAVANLEVIERVFADAAG